MSFNRGFLQLAQQFGFSAASMDAAMLLNESLQNKSKLIQSSGCQLELIAILFNIV